MIIKPRYEGLLSLGNISLFVRQFGEKGQEVIVIHGGPDWDHTYLLPIAGHLQKCSRVTFFDIRGCGRSESPVDLEEFTRDQVVDDLVSLLNVLKLEKAILLGFSFGGSVALSFASKHADRLRSLILASTTAYDDFSKELEDWDEYNQRNGLERQRSSQALLKDSGLSYAERNRRYIQANLDLDVYQKSSLAKAREVTANIISSGKWLEAWQMGKMGNLVHQSYRPFLRVLDIPVLILHGEKDMRFPVSVARRLKSEVPSAELKVIHQAGHLAYLENLEEWCAMVRNFIQSTEVCDKSTN